MNFFFAGRTNPMLMAFLKILRVTSVLACVASVSSRVIARKLEREQKKFLFFFFSRPNFLDELAQKRLLCRLHQFQP